LGAVNRAILGVALRHLVIDAVVRLVHLVAAFVDDLALDGLRLRERRRGKRGDEGDGCESGEYLAHNQLLGRRLKKPSILPACAEFFLSPPACSPSPHRYTRRAAPSSCRKRRPPWIRCCRSSEPDRRRSRPTGGMSLTRCVKRIGTTTHTKRRF